MSLYNVIFYKNRAPGSHGVNDKHVFDSATQVEGLKRALAEAKQFVKEPRDIIKRSFHKRKGTVIKNDERRVTIIEDT